MTHEETVQNIIRDHIPSSVCMAVNVANLRAAIYSALVTSCNDELERRRSAERELENIKAGSPIILCEENRVALKVWNPKTQSWWQTDLQDQQSRIGK